jgi:urease accessory protein
MPLRPALDGFLAAFASNLVSGAVRMSVVGQTEGQRIVARLAPIAVSLAAQAQTSTLDDLGGCAFRADLASFHHETQNARLFRS